MTAMDQCRRVGGALSTVYVMPSQTASQEDDMASQEERRTDG
jgi:hypothetical protein